MRQKNGGKPFVFTSKGHFAASSFWNKLHLCINIPVIVLSAIIVGLIFFVPENQIIWDLSFVIVVLSVITIFISSSEKAKLHLSVGNSYDSLMNKIRIFWSIDC
jgi:membrane protein YdbS with pleckstrin-like domain